MKNLSGAYSLISRQGTGIICSLLVLAVVATMVWFVSDAVVWLGDDANYQFFIVDSIWGSHGEIKSLTDLFRSQGNHYMYVNGRFVAHVLVQLYDAMLGQGWFAISNAIVWPLFIWLIAAMAMRRPLRHPVTMLGLSALAIITFVTKMMPCTQIGFIWMFALTLLWLRLLMHRRERPWWAWSLIFILGIPAGDGQEALSVGLAASLGIWCLRKRFRIGKGRIFAICGFWIGTLALCLAPSMLSRAETLKLPFGESLTYFFFSLRATYVMLAVIIWVCLRKKIDLREIYRRNALWLNCMLVLAAFSLFVGVYVNRQLFGIELCALVVTLRVLPHRRITLPWTLTFAVLAALMVTAQINGITHVRKQYRDIEYLAMRSADRNVFYDRTMASTNVFMREYHYYEEIVALLWADPLHSMSKKIKHLHPEAGYIHVVPTCVRTLPADTVIPYAPEHWAVVVPPSDTPKVLVTRKSVLPPFAESTDTLKLARTLYRDSKRDVYIVLSDKPFRETVGVRIIHDRKNTQ